MQQDDNGHSKPRKRNYAAHSDDLRATVVRLRDRGDSWAQIEAVTALPHATAQQIVRVAQAEGRTAKKPKGGALRTVYPDAVRLDVVSAQDTDNALRLSDHAARVADTFHTSPPSLSTVWRMLDDSGFTTKQGGQYANQRNTADTKQKRAAWCRDVAPTLTADTAVFVDETPFSLHTTRRRAKSRRGTPAIIVVPGIRSKNHSVIAAISPRYGLLHYQIKVTEPSEEFISKRKGSKKKKTRPKGVTRDIFRSFLLDLFHTPTFAAATQPFTLCFDNARIHTGDIADSIFEAGHIKASQPAWSPELNPIELVFNTWKAAYKPKFPDSDDAVDEAIKKSATVVTSTLCAGCFEHTKSLYPKVLALEDL
jgi:hypothetical protein